MFPTLESDRLYLREITDDDLDCFYPILANPLVTQFYGQDPLTSKDQAQAIIQHFKTLYSEKKGIRWGIERKAEKGLIGTIGFHLWSAKYKRAEIGYELDPEFWRKGYISEAIQTILSYGFSDMDLNRIGAHVYQDNLASSKLLEKIGFQHEGILREYMTQGGKYFNTNSYSILKSEFKDGHKNDFS